MIGAPVPGVVNALQVTIPGRSPSVPSVKALGNARDEKKIDHAESINVVRTCNGTHSEAPLRYFPMTLPIVKNNRKKTSFKS